MSRGTLCLVLVCALQANGRACVHSWHFIFLVEYFSAHGCNSIARTEVSVLLSHERLHDFGVNKWMPRIRVNIFAFAYVCASDFSTVLINNLLIENLKQQQQQRARVDSCKFA